VLKVLSNGDTLIVTHLYRLGRSLRDLANIAHEIEAKGAALRVLEHALPHLPILDLIQPWEQMVIQNKNRPPHGNALKCPSNAQNRPKTHRNASKPPEAA
jgi:hypothetical protein